jgi:hypothetical protein
VSFFTPLQTYLSISAFFLLSLSHFLTPLLTYPPTLLCTVPYRTVLYRTVHPYSPSPVSGATYSVPLPPSSVLVSENFVSRVVDANELSALTSCRLGKITQVRNCTLNFSSCLFFFFLFIFIFINKLSFCFFY